MTLPQSEVSGWFEAVIGVMDKDGHAQALLPCYAPLLVPPTEGLRRELASHPEFVRDLVALLDIAGGDLVAGTWQENRRGHQKPPLRLGGTGWAVPPRCDWISVG